MLRGVAGRGLSPVSGELLLELLSEEIPARMQRRAIADLKTHLDELYPLDQLRRPPLEPVLKRRTFFSLPFLAPITSRR